MIFLMTQKFANAAKNGMVQHVCIGEILRCCDFWHFQLGEPWKANMMKILNLLSLIFKIFVVTTEFNRRMYDVHVAKVHHLGNIKTTRNKVLAEIPFIWTRSVHSVRADVLLWFDVARNGLDWLYSYIDVDWFPSTNCITSLLLRLIQIMSIIKIFEKSSLSRWGMFDITTTHFVKMMVFWQFHHMSATMVHMNIISGMKLFKAF